MLSATSVLKDSEKTCPQMVMKLSPIATIPINESDRLKPRKFDAVANPLRVRAAKTATTIVAMVTRVAPDNCSRRGAISFAVRFGSVFMPPREEFSRATWRHSFFLRGAYQRLGRGTSS